MQCFSSTQNLPEEANESQSIELRAQNVIISTSGEEKTDGSDDVQIAHVDGESSAGQID